MAAEPGKPTRKKEEGKTPDKMSGRSVRLPLSLWACLETKVSEVNASQRHKISVSTLMRRLLVMGLEIDVEQLGLSASVRRPAGSKTTRPHKITVGVETKVVTPEVKLEDDLFLTFQNFVRRTEIPCRKFVISVDFPDKLLLSRFYHSGFIPEGQGGEDLTRAIKMWILARSSDDVSQR